MTTVGRQLTLFPRPKRPHIWRMHVEDAGDDGEREVVAKFRCARCGAETGWIGGLTVTAARRGLPCPQCNPNHYAAGTAPTVTTGEIDA